MRFYLESFQLRQLYCQEFGQAEGWLSIRLKIPEIDGITRTFGWKARHLPGSNDYELKNHLKFSRQLLYYGPTEDLTYEIFVVESDEDDRKAIHRIKAARELLSGLADKLPPPYNLSGDVLRAVSAASSVVEMQLDDDLEIEAGGSLPTLQEIHHLLTHPDYPDQIYRAGIFSVMQSTTDVDLDDPPQGLPLEQIAKSVTFRIEFDQLPVQPQEWSLRVAVTRVHIPNNLLENKIFGIRMNRHRNLILTAKLGMAGSSIPYSVEVPVINGSANAARVVGIDPRVGILLFNGKWNSLTEFFYEVTLRLGKEGRVWLSDKLHYKERKLEEERKVYEDLAKSTTKLIDSTVGIARKHREEELKKAIKITASGPDRIRLQKELAALPSREWDPVNILRAGVTELTGIINEIIPDDKTLHSESGSFYLEPPPQGASPLQSLPARGWQSTIPGIQTQVIYLVPNQHLIAEKLNSVQFDRPDPTVFYLKLLLTRSPIPVAHYPSPSSSGPSQPCSSTD